MISRILNHRISNKKNAHYRVPRERVTRSVIFDVRQGDDDRIEFSDDITKLTRVHGNDSVTRQVGGDLLPSPTSNRR